MPSIKSNQNLKLDYNFQYDYTRLNLILLDWIESDYKPGRIDTWLNSIVAAVVYETRRQRAEFNLPWNYNAQETPDREIDRRWFVIVERVMTERKEGEKEREREREREKMFPQSQEEAWRRKKWGKKCSKQFQKAPDRNDRWWSVKAFVTGRNGRRASDTSFLYFSPFLFIISPSFSSTVCSAYLTSSAHSNIQLPPPRLTWFEQTHSVNWTDFDAIIDQSMSPSRYLNYH